MAFARETDAFLNARIAHLSKTPEQHAAEAEAAKRNKAEAETKSGILPAAKYVFTHKQTRNLLFATMPCCFATMAFATYYETIMASSGMGTDQVSVALFVYPLFASAVALLVGYVTDRFGRKPAGVMTAVLTFVSLFLFIFTAQRQMPSVVVGMLLGIETGAFWRYNELLTLTMREIRSHGDPCLCGGGYGADLGDALAGFGHLDLDLPGSLSGGQCLHGLGHRHHRFVRAFVCAGGAGD